MGLKFLGPLTKVLGKTVVKAGFSALCSQASVKLLEAKGDPLKALKALARTDTVKSVATAMASAGILKKVGAKLGLPKKLAEQTTPQQLQYNVARASIATMLNVTINGEDLEKAMTAGVVDAAVGTMAGIATHEIGTLYNLNELDPLTHKLAHGLVGGLSGMALKGEKGFVAGAIGAMAAEITAEALQPKELEFVKGVTKQEQNKGRKLTAEERQELRSAFKVEKDVKTLNKDINKAVDYSKITAATTAFFLHQDVNLASQTATTSLENNFLQNAMLYIDYYRYLEEANLRDGAQQAESNDEEFKKAAPTKAKTTNNKMVTNLPRVPATNLVPLATPNSPINFKILEPSQNSKAPSILVKGRVFKLQDGSLGFTVNYKEKNSRNVSTFYGKAASMQEIAAKVEFISGVKVNNTNTVKINSGGMEMLPKRNTSETGLKVFRNNSTKPLLFSDIHSINKSTHKQAIGRGASRSVIDNIDELKTTLLHPLDTARDLGVMIFDGYNAITDLTFGWSTEASRTRNAQRGMAINSLGEEIVAADSVKRAEMLAYGATTIVAGIATGKLLTSLTKPGMLKLFDVRRTNKMTLSTTSSTETAWGTGKSSILPEVTTTDLEIVGPHSQISITESSFVKGKAGETAQRHAMERAGFDSLNCELPQNHGFDGVWLKRKTDGDVRTIVITESKYNKHGELKLGKTTVKGTRPGKPTATQMDPQWVKDTLRQMEMSSDPEVRATALLIEANQKKLVFRANVLDPKGFNRWKEPTRIVQDLHADSSQPQGPPKLK